MTLTDDAHAPATATGVTAAVAPAGDAAVDPDGQLIAAIRTSVLRLGRRLRLEREGEVTATQLGVLGLLSREGPITVGDIANHERVKPPSATRIVTLLEDAGLVARSASDDDGRQVIVSLTEAGLKVLVETRRRRDAWLREHLADLSAADRRVLEQAAPLLDRLADL